MPYKVAIVGGGITGLAAAHFLESSSEFDIVLIEPKHLGGKVATTSKDGFLLEEGPDCFYSMKTDALELAKELGLEEQLIAPKVSGFQMLVSGRLHEVPYGLISFTDHNAFAIESTTFLSSQGKRRALEEPQQLKGGGADESVASFFGRRFGREFSEKIAEPLLAGTHGGNGEHLSMAALYPSYLEMEQMHGSLYRPRATVSSSPAFLSFRNGMDTFPKALKNSLSRTNFQNVSCTSISEGRVETDHGSIEANSILCATPAYITALLLEKTNRQQATLAEVLEKLQFASSRILTVSFPAVALKKPLAGTGFLVPQSEPGPISGCTYSSDKWVGRAPPESVLLRIFIRGEAPEEEGLAFIKRLLEIVGAPDMSHITNWSKGLPQYEVGHLDWMNNIDGILQELPWLHLSGASYRGIGISDCIRQARESAAKMVESFP